MFIQNQMAIKVAYTSYSANIKKLAASTQRLSSGEKLVAPSDSAGQLSVADQMKLKIKGSYALLSGVQSAYNYSERQYRWMNHTLEIIARMSELAASAVDGLKVTADRVLLNQEFQSLSSEVTTLAWNGRYERIGLFSHNLTIRAGIEASDNISLSPLNFNFGALSFPLMSIATLSGASYAMGMLPYRTTQTNSLRDKARSNCARMERAMDYIQTYTANLSLAESAVRDTEVALEMEGLVKQQMLVSMGQSILAQANLFSQAVKSFFQF